MLFLNFVSFSNLSLLFTIGPFLKKSKVTLFPNRNFTSFVGSNFGLRLYNCRTDLTQCFVMLCHAYFTGHYLPHGAPSVKNIIGQKVKSPSCLSLRAPLAISPLALTMVLPKSSTRIQTSSKPPKIVIFKTRNAKSYIKFFKYFLSLSVIYQFLFRSFN